ncbi:MAG: alpha-isopropylmalate synthase regulatory domain-containing protein, partial [Candidatus Bathyarchaeia archaeon]
IYGFETNVNPSLIYQTSRLVSRLTGILVQPNKAVVGENAFAHESGIHTHGVIEQPLTYEPIPPEFVGRERRILAGKHAGTHGLKAILSQMGLELSEAQVKEVLARVKELGDKGKQVTEEDLMAIARVVAGELVREERILNLDELAVMTGNKVIPTASVKVSIDGKVYVASKTGVGPVDAAIKALQEVLNPVVKVNLKEYRLEAITGGSDALAEVVIKVEDDEGSIVSARATREDIVMASVEAMVNAINKLLLRKRTASSRG